MEALYDVEWSGNENGAFMEALKAPNTANLTRDLRQIAPDCTCLRWIEGGRGSTVTTSKPTNPPTSSSAIIRPPH